jgi:hypothetical protein
VDGGSDENDAETGNREDNVFERASTKNRERRKKTLQKRWDWEKNELINLLDDVFAVSLVLQGYGDTADLSNLQRNLSEAGLIDGLAARCKREVGMVGFDDGDGHAAEEVLDENYK